jgi:hypothetical protein
VANCPEMPLKGAVKGDLRVRSGQKFFCKNRFIRQEKLVACSMIHLLFLFSANRCLIGA